MGYIGSGSNIKEYSKRCRHTYKTRRSKKICGRNRIDLLAPSVGSIHGLIKSEQTPHINKVGKRNKRKVDIPLVLHGGSRLRDQDFTNAKLWHCYCAYKF